MTQASEFTVSDIPKYNQSSTRRWILSHLSRNKFLVLISPVLFLVGWFSYSYVRVLIGEAANLIVESSPIEQLVQISLTILLLLVLDSMVFLSGNLVLETVSQRFTRDARQELYVNLLGKTQTFHNRQRVGDIMARITDDMSLINHMVFPGILLTFEIFMGFAVPMLMLATIRAEILLFPIIFMLLYIVTAVFYFRQLNPVIQNQREAFGVMNASLEETISGIEIVKASAQERYERRKFSKNAGKYAEYFAQQGRVEARYLPMIFYGFALGLTFLHSITLFQQGIIDIGQVIAVMGLMGLLRFPIFMSVFSISFVTAGYAGAKRIVEILQTRAQMNENPNGHQAVVQGEILLDNVSFGYDDEKPILKNISFHIRPGSTIAIVGQTGAGKSTFTELLNRTYDVTSGRILVDGVDIRDWELTSLRSQISKIEQDIFLFSRTLAENIAYGKPNATQAEIEKAAKEAQAHDFILSFQDGYETKVGERGVTLSGGQRQRIALARAFLSDPRILILDDSTSAIDSATEDEIQQAIQRAQEGRTTILITHRLSQIRWADHIVLLDHGEILAQGTHEKLLGTSPHYRRIFARYDMALPPLEAKPA